MNPTGTNSPWPFNSLFCSLCLRSSRLQAFSHILAQNLMKNLGLPSKWGDTKREGSVEEGGGWGGWARTELGREPLA